MAYAGPHPFACPKPIPLSPVSHSKRRTRPELLAPAGDWECVHAAIENGADAVYFGLDCGFNARARAQNFHLDELDQVIGQLHRRGLRGYVTLNTLAFTAELAGLAAVIQRIAQAGVDAVLVQDLGVASLVATTCPDLDIHASTQMTLTSAETIDAARSLGIRRVVLAREMSISEIQRIHNKTDMPLEAFVHGALCVAYSGQCLTSESLGGRSANRGQCAQACRLPYDLVCDGLDRDLEDVRYLLSPQDLAGYQWIPDLIDAGVCSLKIEGRLKKPEYVANITARYRQAIDQAMDGQDVQISDTAVREMELSFSRGFSPGWLQGCDHKMLVPGTESAKRGVVLGTVVQVSPNRVVVKLAGPIAKGDGVAFEGDRDGGTQQGGRVFDLLCNGQSQSTLDVETGLAEVVFRKGDVKTDLLTVGQTVWKTDDPKLNRRLRRSFTNTDPKHRIPLTMHVRAACGEPLKVSAFTQTGGKQTITGDQPLEMANKQAATQQMIAEKLGRLGGTPFLLGELTTDIVGKPLVPASQLNHLRRRLVEQLETVAMSPPQRTINANALSRLKTPLQSAGSSTDITKDSTLDPAKECRPVLHVLCRNVSQVIAAADAEIKLVYADFHDIRQYRQAIDEAHRRDAKIFLASVRIHKPNENGLLRILLRHQPDGILCRNLAALRYFTDQGIPTVADFSLNAANELSVDWLRQQGSNRVTPAYDLNREQLIDLVRSVPPSWLEIVMHQHMPMFHMEHCVFCAVLSPGTNKTNCGRPCDVHQVQLRDRVGAVHPLHADVACRNTVYNAVAQSGAEAVSALVQQGIQNFRIELLEENPQQTLSIIDLYRRLLAGELSGTQVWRKLRAANRVGVTRGTMEEKRNPLAIL